MPLPEYVQIWLIGFDESLEPIDCSMISLVSTLQTSPGVP
jgi:hypothetical protein